MLFRSLILNLYLLGMYGSYANQKLNPKWYGYVIVRYYFGDYIDYAAWNGASPSEVFEGAFLVGCSTANLYLNAIIAYEVLTLLKKCNQVIPCGPPSVKKVHWQVAAAYVLAIIVTIFNYFMTQAAINLYIDYEKDILESNADTLKRKASVVYWTTFSLLLLVALLIPVGYLCYVCTIIWCQHLMPSATGRMKELTWFFFRIILVFFLTWIPGLILIIYGTSGMAGYEIPKYANIGFLFCALQSILSTVLAMTKSDVRTYVVRLLTLSYCCYKPAQQEIEETK